MDEHVAEMLLVASVPLNCAAHASGDEESSRALRRLSRLLLEASENGRLGPELLALDQLASLQELPQALPRVLQSPRHGSRALDRAR